MLVLSRKIGETIRIAENIEVTVVEIKQGRVRLGFRCPKEVPILRQIGRASCRERVYVLV